MKLDKLDASLLRLLRGDARLSFRELADRAGSSTPTVAQRVRDLEALGVIRGYHAAVAPGAWPGTLHVVHVAVRPAAVAAVREALAAVPGVEEALTLAGGALSLRVRATSRDPGLTALHAALAAAPDVTSYDARVVLEASTLAAEPTPLEVTVPCHECDGPIHDDAVRARLSGRPHVFCCKGCLAAFKARHDAVADRARVTTS